MFRVRDKRRGTTAGGPVGLLEGQSQTSGKPSIAAWPTVITSTKLWDRALKAFQKHHAEQWSRYCKTVAKRSSAPQSTSSVDDTALPQDSDTVSSIFNIVVEVKESAERAKQGKSASIRKAADKVIACTLTFGTLASTAAQLNPYAAAGWGAVQFVLQVATNDHDIGELCWEGLSQMTYLVSRYQTLEDLYVQQPGVQESKTELEDALSKLYESILWYQVTIVEYATSRLARMKAALKEASKSDFQSILDDIRQQEHELFRLQAIVSLQISNGNFKHLSEQVSDLTSHLQRLDAIVQRHDTHDLSVTDYHQAEERRRILEWVSPIKHENAHYSDKKAALPSTGLWLLNHDSYRLWCDSTVSSTLWLYGLMGTGKTCLTYKAIENLKTSLRADLGEILIHFYCDGTEEQSLSQIKDVTSILRSLVKQLADADRKGTLPTVIVETYLRMSGKGDLTEIQCVDLIRHFVSGRLSTVIVIDGLDECPSEVQRRMCVNMRNIISSTSSVVKLFIASRPIPQIESMLKQFQPLKVDTAGLNSADLATMIDTRVRVAAADAGLRPLYPEHQPDHLQNVICTLQENAQGMFRWAQMALDYLHSSKSYTTMKRRLTRLTTLQNLFDIYDHIFDSMMAELDEEDRNAVRALLTFVLYGVSDTNLSLLGGRLSRNAVAASFAASESWPESFFDAHELVAMCPSFVCIRQFPSAQDAQGADAHFQLAHFSVRDYLVSRRPELYSAGNGEAYLATLCMQSFIISDGLVEANALLEYGAHHWMTHLHQWYNLNHHDWSSATSCGGLQAALDAFLLNEPVSPAFKGWYDYWARGDHTTGFHANECSLSSSCLTVPPSSIFARLILDLGWKDSRFGIATLDVQAHDGLQLFQRHYGMRTVHLAAALYDTDALTWLKQRGADLTVQDAKGCTAFEYVFSRDVRERSIRRVPLTDLTVAQTLLQNGAKPFMQHGNVSSSLCPRDFHDCDLATALAEYCSGDAAKLLFEHGLEVLKPPYRAVWYAAAVKRAIQWRNFPLCEYLETKMRLYFIDVQKDLPKEGGRMEEGFDLMVRDCDEVPQSLGSPDKVVYEVHLPSSQTASGLFSRAARGELAFMQVRLRQDDLGSTRRLPVVIDYRGFVASTPLVAGAESKQVSGS